MGRIDDPDSGNSDRGNSRQDSSYPSAPTPPHERVWRHPSELGFAAATAVDAEPVNIGRTGRSLLGISTVGATVLLATLFVALQPSSPDPDAQDVIALTSSELRIASFDHPGSLAFEVSADVPRTDPMGPDDAVGLLLPDGNFLITTMSAIAEAEAIDVRLTGGGIVRARVVQTYPDLSVAVLSISERATIASGPEIDVLSIVPRGAEFVEGQLVMALVDIPRQLRVSGRIDDVLYALQSPTMSDRDMSRISEGAPIVDKSGRLVGLCTHVGGVLGFIPFVDIEEALARWIIGGAEGTTGR